MTSFAQTLKRSLREAQLYPKAFGAKKPKRLAFLPSSPRERSGLLRAYLIAEELQQMGWDCMVVPSSLNIRQRSRLLRGFDPQFVVLQQCRHPLNRFEYVQDYAFILDVDDADFLDARISAEIEQVARHARGIICGSRFVQSWAATHNDNTDIVWTGSPQLPGPWPAQADRGRIVTWAQSNPLSGEEELAFIEEVLFKAQALTAPFTFRLYGWKFPQDHPRLARLRAQGIALDLVRPLPYPDFLASLREVSVGLSAIVGQEFSLGKSFGKILGYLDAKTPIICSDGADHVLFFTPQTAVVSNDPEVWAREIAGLLDDTDRRTQLSERAYEDYEKHLSIRAAARKTCAFLDRTLASG